MNLIGFSGIYTCPTDENNGRRSGYNVVQALRRENKALFGLFEKKKNENRVSYGVRNELGTHISTTIWTESNLSQLKIWCTIRPIRGQQHSVIQMRFFYYRFYRKSRALYYNYCPPTPFTSTRRKWYYFTLVICWTITTCSVRHVLDIISKIA